MHGTPASILLLLSACASCGDATPSAPVDAGLRPVVDASTADAATLLVDAGAQCGRPSPYRAGTTAAEIQVGGITRSFRVHVPPGYDAARAAPLVLMLHGGGGSGRQLEENSAGMDAVADREGFVVAYPDGTGLIRSWNAGGCCRPASESGADDVGFASGLIDHLQQSLCIDAARVYAAGMSNGAMLAHRLACELSPRLAAIAAVAGTDMTTTCAPVRPVAVLHIHGTADGHVPFDGGFGCGPANVPFTSVPETLARWRTRNGCSEATTPWPATGDAQCAQQTGCAGGADVVLCRVQGGGHSWPGGEPPAGLVDCPGNGPQSTTFQASEAIWRFFAAHR